MRPIRFAFPRRRARGTSLLEALVALVVLGFGTLAIAQLHSRLRDHGDVARQRSEAVRLATRELEDLRAFGQVGAASGVRSYAAIGDDDGVVDPTPGAPTAYRLSRRVDAADVPGAKATSIDVSWSDRTGATERILLATFIAGADPRYSGALALGAGTYAMRTARGRAAAIPVGARDLGDGRSAWKSVESGTTAYLFDNASGAIVARCSGIAAATATADLVAGDLAACDTASRLLVSGTIRFTSATPPLAGAANDVPLAVGLAVTLAGGPYPIAPECSVEAMKTVRYDAGGTLHVASVPLAAAPASVGVAAWEDSGERYATYRCAIAPGADGRWSGMTTLVADGWTIGAGAGDHRVCRYGGVAGDAHPAAYVDVAKALPAQNFLVVGAGQDCPTAPAVRLTGEGVVVQADLGTVAHQP